MSVWFLLLLLKSWQWKSNIIIMAFLSFLYKMLDHLSVSVLEETQILTLCWLEISLECTTILISIFLTTTTGLSLLDPHLLSIPGVSFSLIFIACSIKKLLLHRNRDTVECDRNWSAMCGHAIQVSVMVLYPTTVLIQSGFLLLVVWEFCFCRMFFCVHVCGGQRSILDVTFRTSLPCALRQDLWLGTGA